ncbi:MAG: hypothetical protein H6609_19315 [Ignavibacteriales bacterium]|nr:hypothetical protein [Ignavibacteriales bacterium]
MKYVHPDYESLKPRSLIKSVKKLNDNSYTSNARKHSITPDELNRLSHEAIRQDPRLVKLCAYYLNNIEVIDRRSELYKLVLDYLSNSPKSFTQIYKQLFYRFLENTNDEQLQNFLILNQLKIRGKFKTYITQIGYKFFNHNFSEIIAEELVNKVIRQNTESTTISDKERKQLIYEYRLLTHYRSYQEIINDYVLKIISFKTFFDNGEHFKKIIDTIIHEKNKKKIFERIIDKIPNDRYEEERFDIWIKYIHSKLGKPYSETRYKWIGISEEIKNKYNYWVVKDEIYFFFDRKDPSKRADFWKKYAYDILRLEYVAAANKAVLMFTNKNQMMVEFLQIGNAYYIYQLNNLEEFEKLLNNIKYDYPYRQLSILKGNNSFRMITDVPYNVKTGGWHHTPYWENNFHTNLRKLGYKQK